MYKGQLSHRNAAKFGDKKPGTTLKPGTTKPAAAEPAPATAPDNGHDTELEALLNYVIPPAIQSKHAGKKLGEVSAQVIEWYATKMAVTTPESQELKDKAAALFALQLQPA